MELTVTDMSDAPPPEVTLAAGQRLLRVVETDDAGAETGRGHVRITVTTDRGPQAVRWTLRGWLLDEAGAYVEVAGEPVTLPASEHTWMLGEAEGSPTEALTAALELEASRLWLSWRQLAAL